MEFVIYIYASKQPEEELELFRCPRCGRIIFSTNSKRIFITNAYGASFTELPPSSNYIESKCHACKSKLQILFQ
jgi:uncharacterized C2H2 Zn-finger protein